MIPLQKTVHMINDTAGKVQNELDQTMADLKEYAKFSDNEVMVKGYATKEVRIKEKDDGQAQGLLHQ